MSDPATDIAEEELALWWGEFKETSLRPRPGESAQEVLDRVVAAVRQEKDVSRE